MTSVHARARLLGALLGLAALALPAPAGAAQRWASPTSTTSAASCTALAPCKLSYAISGSSAGDEVVLAPGDYQLNGLIQVPHALDLHGEAGKPRPRILGGVVQNAAMLQFKVPGTVRHLELVATGGGEDPLTLGGGAVGEDLVLTSADGDGAKIVGHSNTTVLRDSVATTGSSSGSAAGLKLRDGAAGSIGDIAIRNVTVRATGGANGIRCETNGATSTMRNVIVRGAGEDIDAATGAHCSVAHTNYRPDNSSGPIILGSGNQSAEPRFADGDLRPRADSPTIDAGIRDAFVGSRDPDGRPRHLGAAPDIGAFEADGAVPPAPLPETPVDGRPSTPPGTGTEPPSTATPRSPAAALEDVAPPAVGQTMSVAPASGVVLVRKPGGRGFTPLKDARTIPVGTIFDTTRGALVLRSALPGGATQDGTFRGGKFEVRQSRADGYTELHLRGGDFSKCRRRAKAAVAVAAARSRRRRSG